MNAGALSGRLFFRSARTALIVKKLTNLNRSKGKLPSSLPRSEDFSRRLNAQNTRRISLEKILVIQLNRMGDCFQTLHLLKGLKEEKPGSSLTLLCVDAFVQIFKRLSCIDRIVSLPYSLFQALKQERNCAVSELAPELAEDYDSVINLTSNETGAFFSSGVRGKNRSGFYAGPPQLRVKGDWAKYLFASQKDRQMNLFNLVEIQMGMAGVALRPVPHYVTVCPGEMDHAQDLLDENGYAAKGRLIAIQLGASKLHRAWPIDSFASLADSLLKKPDMEIVLLGSAAERELSSAFLSRVSGPVIDLVGKTQMGDLPGLLKACDLLVSNDTGSIHVAAAVGTRALGIYFSTAYFAETAPYGEGHVVLQAELPCCPCNPGDMCSEIRCRDIIRPDAVRLAVEMMLDGKTCMGLNDPWLSAYRSSFLPNGALAYVPILGKEIPEHYLAGLVWRSAWGAALGIESDSACLPEVLAKPDSARRSAAIIDEILKTMAGLSDKYSCAAELARLAILEITGHGRARETLSDIGRELSSIDLQITSSAPSLIKYFHLLETADVDYDDSSKAVKQLYHSYSKLGTMTGSIASNLEALRRSFS
jgi:ADP-heptose:LPS heptosyltransferase